MTVTREEVRAAAVRLAGASPEAVLTWALETYGDRAALTCSFSGPGVVLAHMVARISPRTPVLFLDTGYHFPETLAFKERFARHYGLNVVDVRPALSPEEQEARHGPRLYERDPDLCCRIRKVEPLARLLEGLDAWVTGLRRDQSETRAGIDVLEYHETPTGHPLVKVMPLAHWTRRDVWAYIHRHGIPYHPLLDAGYTSIGCQPCTRPVSAGEPERAGRWAGFGKTECGLHTFTRKPTEGGKPT